MNPENNGNSEYMANNIPDKSVTDGRRCTTNDVIALIIQIKSNQIYLRQKKQKQNES